MAVSGLVFQPACHSYFTVDRLPYTPKLRATVGNCLWTISQVCSASSAFCLTSVSEIKNIMFHNQNRFVPNLCQNQSKLKLEKTVSQKNHNQLEKNCVTTPTSALTAVTPLAQLTGRGHPAKTKRKSETKTISILTFTFIWSHFVPWRKGKQ